MTQDFFLVMSFLNRHAKPWLELGKCSVHVQSKTLGYAGIYAFLWYGSLSTHVIIIKLSLKMHQPYTCQCIENYFTHQFIITNQTGCYVDVLVLFCTSPTTPLIFNLLSLSENVPQDGSFSRSDTTQKYKSTRGTVQLSTQKHWGWYFCHMGKKK